MLSESQPGAACPPRSDSGDGALQPGGPSTSLSVAAGAMNPLSGTRLGHFHVGAEIGRGGMSVVYAATDARLGRRVALKVIDPALAADPEFRERFIGEAKNTSALDHPHVVPLYDFDESSDGWLYIAMRHVCLLYTSDAADE